MDELGVTARWLFREFADYGSDWDDAPGDVRDYWTAQAGELRDELREVPSAPRPDGLLCACTGRKGCYCDPARQP